MCLCLTSKPIFARRSVLELLPKKQIFPRTTSDRQQILCHVDFEPWEGHCPIHFLIVRESPDKSWKLYRCGDQNFDFYPKFGFFAKIFIFTQNSDFSLKFLFLPKILILRQNFDFYPKFWFLPKISIFTQNSDFYSKFWFFAKISILTQNSDFIQNLWPDFVFWSQFRFLTKSTLVLILAGNWPSSLYNPRRTAVDLIAGGIKILKPDFFPADNNVMPPGASSKIIRARFFVSLFKNEKFS